MKSLSRLLSLFAVLILALSGLGTGSASADSGSATYVYLIGVDPLCGLDPSACPDVAMAHNGDTVALTGAGTFSIHPKSASGGGTFVHMNATGAVLGSGTWTATELLSFHSYGSATVQGLPPEFEGGKALIRVHLLPSGGGSGFDAILRVTCLLGDKIPAGAEEGVRLAVPTLNFNKEVSGFTLFIRVP